MHLDRSGYNFPQNPTIFIPGWTGSDEVRVRAGIFSRLGKPEAYADALGEVVPYLDV